MISDLHKLFVQAFPELDHIAQQQAILLYQLLATGNPVSVETFAESIQLNINDTQVLLDSWTGVSFNTEHQIDAFWGLSTSETPHRFNVGEQTLYTWCAWDLLFMPVILKQTVYASTQCPLSKQEITLTISENGVEEINPDGAMITFIKPELAHLKENVVNSFCQYIFFVASETTGKTWQQKNEKCFLLTIDQGFELGKEIIHSVFKDLQ